MKKVGYELYLVLIMICIVYFGYDGNYFMVKFWLVDEIWLM